MEIDLNESPLRLAALGTSPASGGGKTLNEPDPLSSPVYGGGGSQARSDCETEGGLQHRIVKIARSWIGTPYVHQASVKHVGCDCLGLLRGLWRELFGEEPEETPPYSLDWAEATGAETLYMALKRHAREIDPSRLAVGDIALFRMLPRGPAKHCGIVAALSPRPHACGGEGPGVRGLRKSEVRTQKSERAVSTSDSEFRVPFSDFRHPLTLNPSPPPRGGEGDSLTLIHARQNKRVSEEPLTLFWRSKLAFAFRL